MPNRACHAPIRAAVGKDLTDEQIDEIMRRVTAELDYGRIEGNVAARLSRKPLTPEQIKAVIAKQTRAMFLEGLLKRRMEAAHKVAMERFEASIAAMPDTVGGKAFDAAEKIRAYNTGSERTGTNLAFSVEAEGKARFNQVMSKLDEAIEASGAKDLLNPMFNKAGREEFERKVAIETARANGADLPATGDDMAVSVGKALATSLEEVRLQQNNVGAWIKPRPGYIAKQNHDAMKLAGGFWAGGVEAKAKAFQKWHDYIRPRLSEETFKDIDISEFDAARLARNGDDARRAFLEVVWENIVYGQRLENGKVERTSTGAGYEFEYRAPTSKARAVSKDRTLHFTSPDSWLEYHRQYGQGSLYSVVVGQIEGGTRNAALMNRWGPNPEAAFQNVLEQTATKLRNEGGPSSGETIDRLEGKGKASLLSGNLLNEWDVLTGRTQQAHDLKIAAVGNVIRLDQRLSKLGGAVLAGLGPDQAIASAVMKRHGLRYLDGYTGAFGGILRMNGKAQAEAGKLLGVGAKAAAMDMAARFEAGDGVAGMSAALTNMLFKVTGFNFVMDGHRRGIAAMWSSWAAEQARHGFDQLPEATRAQLGRYGLGAADWEAVRGNVATLSDGNRYLHFDGIEGERGLKWRAYVAQMIDDTLTEPGVREQAKLTGGLQRGTVWGEVVRCFTQFKAFPLTYMTRHLNPTVERAVAGEAGARMDMAHLIIASTLMGFVAMQAKQLAKGQTPRPLTDEEGNPRLDTWVAALMQGGGMGLYGDFLFANYSRAGGPIETISGPAIGEAGNVLKLMARLANFTKYDDDTIGDIGADSLRLIKSNTPFANVWFARHALDQLILFRMQEAISPGYLERYQDRMKKEQGTEYIVKPAV